MKMKRLFWALLTLTMVLGMSLTAYADVTTYNLWVGGTRVTSNNLSGAGWSYEATTKTLTLNGANISAIGNDDAAIKSEENLTIDVTGVNTVRGPDNINKSYSYGISVEGQKKLTIKGSGTLTATGGEANAESLGVYAGGEVTVEEGGKLTATGGEATLSYGVYAGGEVTVEEGGTLYATGGKTNIISCGVYANGAVTVEEGGTLYATGDESFISHGVFAEGEVTVEEGGTLYATGGKTNFVSYGVEGGEVTVEEGGTLYATGGEATYSNGVYAGAVTVKGTLTATGGKATETSNGVYAEGDVTVKGTLTAAGNTQAITGNVKNFIAGIGWTNVEGTTGKADIVASTTGQNLSSYKKVQFLAYTVTYKVVGGTWSDGTKEDKKETVQSDSKPASVPTGMKASEGYTGGAWDTNPADTTITGAKTFTYNFSRYSYISGEGSTWTKSTGLPLTFQIKNTVNDLETYGKFVGLQVDGKQLTKDKEYTTSRGSVIILKPTFLESLSVGEHTIQAEFTDGKADAKFTVAASTVNLGSLPQTGDKNNVLIYALIGLLAIAGLGLTIKKQ